MTRRPESRPASVGPTRPTRPARPARTRRAWTIGVVGAAAAVLAVGGGVWGMVALAGGSGAAPTSASAGSTGEEPAESVIAGATRMGTVELHTADLDAMTDFYVGGVGLVPLSEDEPSVALGADVDADAGASAEELIRLVGVDAPTANPADAGLYHTAIRFPDEPALARALLRVGSLYPSAYQGSADHAVSLAFYFADPEGNGVELYVDRPRNEWVWQDGEVQMGSAALDPNAFLEEHLDGETAGIADVGHVHLKVGDLDIAREFYEGVLGFAVTAEADGAIFLSAGGYHHHLAANTWGSAGAGARQTTLGLGSVEVVVPVASDLDALVARLDAAGVGYEHTDSALTVADPWGTRVAFRIEA